MEVIVRSATVPVIFTYQPPGTNRVIIPKVSDSEAFSTVAAELVGPMAIVSAAAVVMLIYKCALLVALIWRAVVETNVSTVALWLPGAVEPAVIPEASV